MYRKNTTSQFVHFQGVDATTGGIKSGVTWTMRRCIDGTFAAGGGTVTEDGTTGWYKCALTQADTNGNDIGFNFTGTGAVPQTINIVTTAGDPTDSVRFGLTALPNAAAGANTGLPVVGTQVPNASSGASGGLPVIGTGANNFKSDASANVTYANAAPPTAAAISTQVGTDLSSSHGAGSWATATGFSVAGDAMTLTAGERTSINTVIKTTAITEAYRANGAAPTEAQFMSEVLAHLGEAVISGTTKTIKKLDHSTTAETFTLDSATTPAAITRAT